MLQVLLYRGEKMEKWKSEVFCEIKPYKVTHWLTLFSIPDFSFNYTGAGACVYDDLITNQVEKIPSENNDFDSLVKYNYTQIKNFK